MAKSEDGRDKALHDTRGTAATKMLNARLSLAKIANDMGRSVRCAPRGNQYYKRKCKRHGVAETTGDASD